MKRVYLIEDDQALRAGLCSILELQGFEVLVCTDFSDAAQAALRAAADLLIVDLRLPGTDGLSICRDVRASSAVPLLVLTSSDAEFDEVMSMKLGADDYLTKPYSPAVLLAHVDRLLERSGEAYAAVLTYAGLSLDTSRSTVQFEGEEAELSRNELRILSALMAARGRIVSRQELMYELWQSDEFIDDNTLTVNVNRLRRALERIGAPADILKTHRGQGYSL